MAKSLSSLLSRREPDDDELDGAMREIHEGSDRAAAILGAAILENTLTNALRAAFEDEDAGAKLIDGFNAPLSAFSSKILYARATKFISANMADEMDIIRDVRNQYAHAPLSITFDNEHIKRVLEKCRLYGQSTDLPGDRPISLTRWHFENVYYWLTVETLRRHNALLDVRHERLRSEADMLEMLTPGAALNGLRD